MWHLASTIDRPSSRFGGCGECEFFGLSPEEVVRAWETAAGAGGSPTPPAVTEELVQAVATDASPWEERLATVMAAVGRGMAAVYDPTKEIQARHLDLKVRPDSLRLTYVSHGRPEDPDRLRHKVTLVVGRKYLDLLVSGPDPSYRIDGVRELLAA